MGEAETPENASSTRYTPLAPSREAYITSPEFEQQRAENVGLSQMRRPQSWAVSRRDEQVHTRVSTLGSERLVVYRTQD
jgi:hypothetical protein